MLPGRLVEHGLDEDLVAVGLLRDREVRQRGAAVLLGEPGERAGEAGVVVRGHLVRGVVGPAVGVGVVRRRRSADQRAVQDVPRRHRVGDRVQPRAVRGPVVRALRRVGAEPDHEAGLARVVAERVVDLPHGEVVVPRLARGVGDPVGVDERDEGGVRGVPQRPPRVEDGLAARRVRHPLPVDPDGPVVEPPVGVVDVLLLARHHGQQHVHGERLVVPRDRPLVGVGRGLVLDAQLGVRRLGLGQVGGVAGRPVEPVRAPDQLVLVAAPRLVVRGGRGHAVGVRAAVGVRERVELLGVRQELRGVRGVVGLEHDRRRGQRRGGLARQVGAGAGRADLVGRPRHRHDLGRTPPLVVGLAVADLPVQHVRRRVCLDEVVVGQAQVVLQLVELPGRGVPLRRRDRAPGEHRGAERHRQAELHVVAGVVPASGEVHADVGAVGHAGVAAPGHPVAGRLVAGPLRLVEEHRLLQRLGVVERRVGGDCGTGQRCDQQSDRHGQGGTAGDRDATAGDRAVHGVLFHGTGDDGSWRGAPTSPRCGPGTTRFAHRGERDPGGSIAKTFRCPGGGPEVRMRPRAGRPGRRRRTVTPRAST